MKETITTEKAPTAIGPYSQAVKHGKIVVTSGQLPLNPETAEIEGNDIRKQTVRALQNLVEVLSAAGASLDDVVKTTCFLNDMDDFVEFNQAYQEFFHSNPPARSCVAVERLPKNVLVEIEALAII